MLRFTVILVAFLGVVDAHGQSLTMWYDKPGNKWEKVFLWGMVKSG